MFPGVDLTIIEGFSTDRYAEILAEIPWQRLNTDSRILTKAPYSTGTVALTNGSASVTLTGGTWTAAMSGIGFRATGRDEIYEFTFGSATTGTLDRPYEGPTATSGTYKIFQHVYVMPSDCRMLEDNAFETFTLGPLKRMNRSELNLSAPNRGEHGTPRIWATYMDDASTPPRIQVEFYPIPDAAIGIPFSYSADAELSTASPAVLAWMNPSALVEGVTASIKRHLKDYMGAAEHAKVAAKSLANMRTSEAQGMEKMTMRLPAFYTAHRRARWQR